MVAFEGMALAGLSDDAAVLRHSLQRIRANLEALDRPADPGQ
jgi:hypothetical protein